MILCQPELGLVIISYLLTYTDPMSVAILTQVWVSRSPIHSFITILRE